MRLIPRLFLCATSLLVAPQLSCSGDDGAAKEPAPKALTYAQFIESYAPKVATIRCRQTLECYDQYDAIPIFRLFSNHPGVESCSQEVMTGRLQGFGVGDPLALEGLEQNRRSFDPEKAAACLSEVDKIVSLDCPAILAKITSLGADNPNSPCAKVLAPLAKEGEACKADSECQQVPGKQLDCLGLTCPGNQGGTCQTQTELPCGRACDTREYCDEDANSCRQRIPLAGPCISDEACEAPAICSGFLNICITPKSQAAKTRCASSIECAPGLRCKPSGDGSMSTCAPLIFRKEGESCSDSSEAEPGPCDRALKCILAGDEGTGTCSALSPQGGPCQQSYHCTPGLACVGFDGETNGTCGSPLPDGSDCNVGAFDPFQCQSINCDFETAKCAPGTRDCSPT